MSERPKTKHVLSIYEKDLVVLSELAGQRSMDVTRYLEQLIETHAAEYRAKWLKPPPTMADEERFGNTRWCPKRKPLVRGGV